MSVCEIVLSFAGKKKIMNKIFRNELSEPSPQLSNGGAIIREGNNFSPVAYFRYKACFLTEENLQYNHTPSFKSGK
jgi:hypothetical protein